MPLISYISPEYCCHNIIIIIDYNIEIGVTPSVFLLSDREDFDDIGLTKFGKAAFLNIFTKVQGTVNHLKLTITARYCSDSF